jgi:porin
MRKQDVTTLGLAHTAFNARNARAARLIEPLRPAPDFEQAIELSHAVVLSERWTVQPDLQYIRHPGGSPAMRNAFVALVRATCSF